LEFIESIRRYQAEGDRTIIDTVREYMNTDFLAYKKRGGTSAFERPEMYIAFRILRMIRGRLSTVKYTLTSEKWVEPVRELKYFEAWIRQYADIELNPNDNFKALQDNIGDVCGVLGVGGVQNLIPIVIQILYETNRRDELIQGEINALYFPLILPALEYALSKVDTERSEYEIVRYINKALLTEYYRLQIAQKGLRRVRRQDDNGDVATTYVLPSSSAGITYAILGSNEAFEYGSLTKGQRRMYDRIYDIVSDDFANKRFGEYYVNPRGYYRTKNRYIAGRLGMHEVSVSRGLKAIRSYLR